MYIVYYELAMERSREREKKGKRVEVRAVPHPEEKPTTHCGLMFCNFLFKQSQAKGLQCTKLKS